MWNRSSEGGPPIQYSLRRQLLSRGGLRSIFVATALCVASYYHVVSILENGLKQQLLSYISERGLRDSEPFLKTERRHLAFEKQFREQWQKVNPRLGARRFDDYFEPWPDGTYRTKQEWYEGHVDKDGLFHSGFTGFIGQGVKLDEEMRHRASLIAGMLDWYGTAWTATGQYINYFVTAPENLLIGEFVGFPYLHHVPADSYFPDEIFVAPANQQNNPQRHTVWTRFYFDETAKVWLVSALRPIYIEDRQVATAGQDILLDDFMKRVIDDKFEGTENLAFDEQGRLIAHQSWHASLGGSDKQTMISEVGGRLQKVYEKVISVNKRSDVVEIDDAYLAFTRISGPNWFLVNIYPKSLLQQHGAKAALIILAIALLGLLTEFLMLWTLIDTTVVKPIGNMLKRVKWLEARARDESLKSGTAPALFEPGCAELAELSNSFSQMADKLDAAIKEQRDINKSLDQEVAVRTEALQAANVQLEKLAITDDLTGLYNRRHFRHCVEEELIRAKRLTQNNTWLTLYILDIDHFKSINDRFGHQAGDAVIARIAHAICACFQRASDKCFRIGGEEFAVLCIDDKEDLQGLSKTIALLLKEIRTLHIPVDRNGQYCSVTLSMGVTCELLNAQSSQDALFHAADNALYQAKERGRDRACLVTAQHDGTQDSADFL
ncbi:diguanylate cyclase [Aliiglaciecola sp. CAU 1673]|uniref:sensor domain-containing diguanylate cyclase n=1 Tax=Aliiglaciecola sp. CAU 1673 TaxID=3032595 RepID=UPI0023DAE241|nr:diguanylate cyclase [Aliiglaciecola sp. CAU 1673]MDF2177025.1 diguanylate cyclase [Aliiglaciecola sp. CAU 1673]